MNDLELKTLISNTSRFVMLQQEEQNRTNIDEEIIEKEIAASKAPCGKPINTTNANAHQSINIKPI